MSRHIVPVSTLVNYLKKVMDENPVLHGVMIEGEISNIRMPYSGHWYFSLKDDHATLKCVMFSSANQKLGFKPENGDKVVLKGDVSVYVVDGSMQMIATNMERSGIGQLYQQFELLKKKLSDEGLFDVRYKKPLPAYPMDIALVTGNNTAAREDALITLKKRWPIAKLTEYPAPVQGMDAAPKIITALQAADDGNHQVIMLVRGGGSIEDLWCFNDETLARYIFQMKTPIVTGIGHEIDFTLVDFVSDYRANTPTGAVEATVPDIQEVLATLQNSRSRLMNAMRNTFMHAKKRFVYNASQPVLAKPERLYRDYITRLDYLAEKLIRFQELPKDKRHELNDKFHRFSQLIRERSTALHESIQEDKQRLLMYAKQSVQSNKNLLIQYQSQMKHALSITADDRRTKLEKNMSLLNAYSPLLVLNRGYSVTYKNNKVVNTTNLLEIGDEINIRLADGTVGAIVQTKEVSHANKG